MGFEETGITLGCFGRGWGLGILWCVRGMMGGEAAFLWWGRREQTYQNCAAPEELT